MANRLALLPLGLLAACAAGRPPLAPLVVPVPAESVVVRPVAGGLVHYDIWSSRGPWSIQVLDVDRAACWSAVALKAGNQAVGRDPARALAQALADTATVFVGGAVNADFFLFEPPGVPVGAHVSGGRVITGPIARPVLAFDSTGAPWIGTLAVRGRATLGGDTLSLGSWNQRRGPGLRLFDAAWGGATDTASGVIEVAVAGAPARVVIIDTTRAASAIPAGGIVLTADAANPVGRRLRAARIGEPASWQVSLAPFTPREAVGGRPVLITDSVLAPDLDSNGGPNFAPVRHPRTAVGIAARGRRLLLVTVDGRQQGFSAGMTLRELATLLRDFGAHDAVNLDGGGSTEMVVNRGGVMGIVNRPSDPIERPVANALAVVRNCD